MPILLVLAWVIFIFNQMTQHIWRFHIGGIALEIYHFPRWLITFIRMQVPQMCHTLSDEFIEPLARRRAEQLAQLAGISSKEEV